jgi:hypothetical protein
MLAERPLLLLLLSGHLFAVVVRQVMVLELLLQMLLLQVQRLMLPLPQHLLHLLQLLLRLAEHAAAVLVLLLLLAWHLLYDSSCHSMMVCCQAGREAVSNEPFVRCESGCALLLAQVTAMNRNMAAPHTPHPTTTQYVSVVCRSRSVGL